MAPDISAVGFLLAGRQHLYRRFIGVNHALGQHHFAQRIDQRLKLYAGLAHPLRQGRTWYSQAGTAEDLFLSIQRQVVGELGYHHVRQQAGSGNALVDHLWGYRGLDQCFALPAGPFPTHVPFDGEHARRVVQFFADVFTDALKLAAASALSVVRLVMDHSAWKLRRQRRTLGLLAWFCLCGSGMEGF